MYRVRITYGHPTDPEAFDSYYANTHVPIASRVPGVRQFFAGRCESFDGSEPDAYYVAELVFASREDAHAGFASPEGQAAAADLANFATGGAAMMLANDDFTPI